MNDNVPEISSEEAEEAVIGAILLDAEKVLPIAIKHQLTKACFTTIPRQTVWDIAVSLKFEDKPIDMITVHNYAKERGIDAEIVPIVLTEMTNSVITVSHTEYYIELIKEKQMKREAAVKINIANTELSGEKSFSDIATELKFELDSIAGKVEKELSKEDIVANIMENSKKATNDGCVGIPSRWMKLQRKIAGYKRKKLAIIAARPSIGKTTFALNEARVMAEKSHSVGIISLETDVEEIYETMAADKAKVDLFKRANEGWNDNEHMRFELALKDVVKLPIYISDKSKSIQHICNWIEFMNTKYDLDVFIVDYIGIITPADSEARMSERQLISRWSKQLFRVAKDCNIAGIVLAQINRSGEAPANAKIEERWKHVPKLYNLKDSGALEEDAYHVMLLYNEPTESDMSSASKIPFIIDVAKHKRGPKGQVKMVFNRDIQRVSPLAE